MTLWLILTIMTSIAAVWLLVPLMRAFERPRDAAAADIAVYQDQLQEVEREVRDGLIEAAQAETARIEIKRRILEAGRAQPAAEAGLSGRQRSVVAVSATAIVVLGSAILYAATGSPELAAMSRGQGLQQDRLASAPRGPAALPPQHPALEGFADATAGSDGEPQTGLPAVEEMTRRLAARLARNPDDTEGWRTLGWSYLNIGRFDEAAAAYAKAIERDPDNAEFRTGRIEALVGAANGVVTSEARAAIGEVLKRFPNDARARYFAGRDGDRAQAVRAADAAPSADRVAMIRGMVEGLASRLEHAPRDADGWIRLIRSRVVLGEGELATQALARGLAAFADDAAERGRIEAAAQEMGVSP
jgi:cytochrome c-type biogenesis protein CcmH